MKRFVLAAAQSLCLLALFMTTVSITCAEASIRHVAGDASRSGDGSSWAEAFQTIEEAVSAASRGDELWIKTGTYPITAEIRIDKPIGLYGGFEGTELKRGQRKRQLFPTILDGGRTNRLLYVSANMTADELTFTRGRVVGTSSVNIAFGGALVIDHARPAFRYCTFADNQAVGYYDQGGAIYMVDSRPLIDKCLFQKNGAYGSGGAIYARNSAPFVRDSRFMDNFATNYHGGGLFAANSSVRVQGCLFQNNAVWLDGGAIYNHATEDFPYSTPLIIDTVFVGNRGWNGGALYNMRCSPTVAYCRFLENTGFHGGAMVNEGTLAAARITNTLFAANTAYSISGNGSGAAMVNINGAIPTITASTFAENMTHLEGSAIYNVVSSGAIVSNSVFWGNRTSYNPDGQTVFSDESSVVSMAYSDVEGGYPGDGNMDADPLFSDPANRAYGPSPGSPIIDRGNNKAAFTGKRDLDGKRRIADGDGDGIPVIDMGAFELSKAEIEVADSLLKVSRTGKGQVTSNLRGIECGAFCQGAYPPVAKVVLSATPEQGWRFDHWEGACAGKNPVCVLNMTRDRTTTAHFSR